MGTKLPLGTNLSTKTFTATFTPSMTPTGTLLPTNTPTSSPTPTSTPDPSNKVTYTYDGDNRLVMSKVGNVVTLYPNAYYEVQGATIRKFYFAGSQRIAIRENNTLTFLLADHLGSTVGTVNSSGNLGSRTKYTAFGETRGAATTSTDYLYTGQRAEAEIGLYFYNARWYDPALARFIQADTIVPNHHDSKSFDKYAYVENNPIIFNDPDGYTPRFYTDFNMLSAKSAIKRYFGITLSGKWSSADSTKAYIGVTEIGKSISPFVGKSSGGSFKTVFGDWTFQAKNDLGGYYGIASYVPGNAIVKLKIGYITPQLIAHELGHGFEKIVYNALGMNVGNAPANLLAKSTLVNNESNHVTGYDPKAGKFVRTMDGYGTCGLLCSYHPDTMGEDGKGPYEDFADMFMNWTFNSFNFTEKAIGAGAVRYKWVNDNMALWISTLP
jgi:RHS repeat-associated protein